MAQIQFASTDTTTWAPRFGNGSDGALTISSDTTDSVANTSCSGTLSSTTLTVGNATGFANGNLVLIHQSRNGGDTTGDWMLNQISSGEGTTTWTMAYALTKNFNTTAQVYLLKQYSGVTINSGINYIARNWNGSSGGILAILCNGTTTVTGTIYAQGKGYRGGTGISGSGGAGPAYEGEGESGSGTTSVSANGSGGGGARQDQTASGGASYQTSTSLTSRFLFGGGGGGGHSFGSGSAWSGGAGGGLVLIISQTITVTGRIMAGGDDGGGNSVNNNGSGGGGGGGCILLKGTSMTLGTNLVTAPGGSNPQTVGADTGGGGAGNSTGASGSPNNQSSTQTSSGRIHADYTTSISGTTSPTLDSTQDNTFSTTTSTSTTSTSTSRTTSTSTTTSTTVSVTTSTSTTSTSRTTSTTTTSTSTTSTSTSTTSTSTTIDLMFSVGNV